MKAHFQMLYWEQGYKVQGTFMTGLGCKLTNLMASSPYSGRLMLCVLGQGLDHSIQVHILIYTKQTDLGFALCTVQAEIHLASLEAHHCWLLLSRLRIQPRSQSSCFSLFTHIVSLVLALSFQGVPCVTSPLPAFLCNSSQQHPPEAKVLERKLRSKIFYPSFTKSQCGERNQSGESNNALNTYKG